MFAHSIQRDLVVTLMRLELSCHCGQVVMLYQSRSLTSVCTMRSAGHYNAAVCVSAALEHICCCRPLFRMITFSGLGSNAAGARTLHVTLRKGGNCNSSEVQLCLRRILALIPPHCLLMTPNRCHAGALVPPVSSGMGFVRLRDGGVPRGAEDCAR